MANSEDKLRDTSSQYLYRVETVFYITVGILLSLAAIGSVVETVGILWRAVAERSLANYGLLMLDRLLLVLMLVEILHTVRISILSKEFMLVRPFLIVGLIASIRRILVITMQAARMSEGDQGSAQSALTFHNEMVELGLLGFLILVLALAIYFLNRTRRSENF